MKRAKSGTIIVVVNRQIVNIHRVILIRVYGLGWIISNYPLPN